MLYNSAEHYTQHHCYCCGSIIGRQDTLGICKRCKKDLTERKYQAEKIITKNEKDKENGQRN